MSQFVLPERMGFNVSPGIMRVDSLLSKLYPRPHGPYFYPPRRGVSGLAACSQATPGDCAGPYSSPQANFDYQQQLQQSGYVSEQPVYNPPPAYTPGGPGEPNCTISAGGLTWVDNDCVAAQSARAIAYQDAIAAAHLAQNLQGCLDSQTPADVCHARYPGVTPSGNVGTPVTPPVQPPPLVVTPPPISYPNPPFQPNPALNQIVAHPLTPPTGGTVAGSTAGTGGTSTDTGAASGAAAIPWYVWAGAAGAAYFFLRGKG